MPRESARNQALPHLEAAPIVGGLSHAPGEDRHGRLQAEEARLEAQGQVTTMAKPSKQTPADSRLKANQPKAKAPAKPGKAAPFGGKQAAPFGSKGKGKPGC